MLHAEKEGYRLPVWCTFNSIQKVLNPEQKGKRMKTWNLFTC